MITLTELVTRHVIYLWLTNLLIYSTFKITGHPLQITFTPRPIDADLTKEETSYHKRSLSKGESMELISRSLTSLLSTKSKPSNTLFYPFLFIHWLLWTLSLVTYLIHEETEDVSISEFRSKFKDRSCSPINALIFYPHVQPILNNLIFHLIHLHSHSPTLQPIPPHFSLLFLLLAQSWLTLPSASSNPFDDIERGKSRIKGNESFDWKRRKIKGRLDQGRRLKRADPGEWKFWLRTRENEQFRKESWVKRKRGKKAHH